MGGETGPCGLVSSNVRGCVISKGCPDDSVVFVWFIRNSNLISFIVEDNTGDVVKVLFFVILLFIVVVSTDVPPSKDGVGLSGDATVIGMWLNDFSYSPVIA